MLSYHVDLILFPTIMETDDFLHENKSLTTAQTLQTDPNAECVLLGEQETKSSSGSVVSGVLFIPPTFHSTDCFLSRIRKRVMS